MRKITIALFAGILIFNSASIVKAESPDLASLQARVIELTKKLEELRGNSPANPNALWLKIKKAPLQLKVGEQGEWRVKTLRLATSTPYTLQIGWESGSAGMMVLPAPAKTHQTVFTYNKYTSPGTYQVTFVAKQGNRESIVQKTVVVTP